MPSIAATISKHVLRNAFVKEVLKVPGEVLLGRVILDSPLLACLLVLDVFVILPATSTYFELTVRIYPHPGQQIAFSVKVRIRLVVSRKVKVE